MHSARAARLRTTAALIPVVAIVAGATACGGSGSGSSGPATVGIAMPTKVSQRWIADGNSLVKQFQAKGYKTDLKYADNSADTQADQIRTMINNGDKLLIIASIDGSGLGDVLVNARQKGIKVISYDRLLLASNDVDYYATFDNFKVGELQADAIVQKLGLKDGSTTGPYTIELFAGSPDDNNTQYFFNGAMKVLQPYIDKKQLVIGSGQKRITQVATLRWDVTYAAQRLALILKENYANQHLDAVLAPYDGISRSLIQTLKNDGYGTAAKPLPVVTGQDAEVDSVKSIIKGEQTETVYKDTRKLAKVTFEMGNALLSGKKPPVNDTKTYDNGNKIVPAYLLQPVSVEKSNYKKELIDSGYIKASDLK
ncbi:multiple monosaccharide ABC transporter substrate-binding protein [Actinacidiphila soli]|jgi:putative multiple sugar transport system substrate-binding protein|uniref:multiple monosaccharide ABC transporter substrate-binding protein n=1 Tax=Actinacidiphila soli TaxID=2487275 RepID=UPI000FCC65EB|nr:multiple monosaccharide ABC transporter substrate-binding protein [Actinacidiphila soli]